MIKVEKLAKQIIEGMYRHYNYVLEDFSSIKENNIPWAISKQEEDGSKVLIHFVNLENVLKNDIVENQICAKFNCNKEQIVTVILISDKKDGFDIKTQIDNLRNSNAMYSNFIILDLVNKQIQTSNNEIEFIANQIVSVVNNLPIHNNEHSIVTYILIALNVIMFGISVILSGGNPFDIDTGVLVSLGAKYNPAISNGQWFRLITCMFLHGGIIHIAANMYSLYAIGPFVEKLYGKLKYASIYFFTGIVASLFSFLFSSNVSVGASGAICGLFGIIFAFAIKQRKKIGTGFLKNIAFVLVINLVIWISIPGIDNFAHMGGLISGILCGIVIKLNNSY